MATKMLTSTPTKEKKKNSSPNKQNRISAGGTLKRNPNYELKKDELIQLLGRFEAELQAKEIAIAALKSEKLKTVLSHARFGCQNDPYGALLRDSEHIKDDLVSEQIPITNAYETQLAQLEELIVQQRKQVQTLKIALDQSEQRFRLLSEELAHEKKDKARFVAFQNQLFISQQEKIQLKNDLNDVQLHNKELEQQLVQVMHLLEYQHERHKKFVALLLNERKIENELHKEQLKKISHEQNNDDSEREAKFKALEEENERNKHVLTARIHQLQNEIDSLLKEKKQETNTNETTDSFVTPQTQLNSCTSAVSSVVVQQASSTAESSVTPSSTNVPTPPNTEKVPASTSSIRRPTVIPAPITSKVSSNSNIKSAVPASINQTKTQSSSSMTNSTSSIPELPASPVSTTVKRNVIPTRSTSITSQSPVTSNLRSSPNNNQPSNSNSSTTISNAVSRNGIGVGGIPRLTKNPHQISKPSSTGSTTGPNKRTGQTSFSSEHKIDNIQTLLETIQSAAENRLKFSYDTTDSLSTSDTSNTENASETLIKTSSSSNPDLILFRAAENGELEQLTKFLKLGSNPNSQMIDGNTCLHLSTAAGHLDCVRILLKHGANSFLENNLGLTSWHYLAGLEETTQLDCLQIFVDISQLLPPIDLLFDAIDRNRMNTYDYLLSLFYEDLKSDVSYIPRLLRTALRSTNTHFLECLFSVLSISNFIDYFDPNIFVSNECLMILSSLNQAENYKKAIDLVVRISSSNHENLFSYAIGTISITSELSWVELERICTKLFVDHIVQIDSPFDYIKSSIGCVPNSISSITLGLVKWNYQDSRHNECPMPYTAAHNQNDISIHLKGIESNATDSLAYNYFIPSQNLKTFIRYVEQNTFVGVYGAPHLQKKSLFEDLMRYLERPMANSNASRFKLIRFTFESIGTLDDFVDELVEQDFFRTQPYSINQSTPIKHLLFLPDVQNGVGTDALHLLLNNSESIINGCQQICYTREDTTNSSIIYYFPSAFHIFVTMSKRTWSTENEIYKRFKWIPFKIDSIPWNGLLKRHLWRRMIDTNVRENRAVDPELIKTLHWIANVWQRYNECLQKLSIQDALLGPGVFFDCPMECAVIYEWLQNKWNTIVAPLVREFSMNKCAQPKSKGLTAAATAIASSFRANSLEINTPYESVACTALYVLLHRAVSRDCPLTGQEREQYLLNFVGSRLDGSGSSSVISSAASSRASTPQPSGQCDFISIQLE